MLKPLTALLAVSTVFMSCAVTASAATVSQGMSGELTSTSQTDDGAELNAVVKNSNYYGIDGISYEVSVTSGNATLSGETKKDNISLGSEESDSLDLSLSFTKTEEPGGEPAPEQPSENDNDDQKKPDYTLTPGKPAEDPAPAPDKDANADTSGGAGKAAAVAAIALVVLTGAAAAKKNKRLLSLVLCFAMASTIVSVSLPASAADEEEAVGYSSLTDSLELTFGNEKVTVELTVTFPTQDIHDNSEEDIEKLNNGDVSIVRYDKNDRVAFIGGKYTDYKVTNAETAMSSLAAVYTLLDVKDNDITVNLSRIDIAENGDTFYTFEQCQGLTLVTDCYIKIGVDKDGNTICLSSSIDPSATAIEDFDVDDAKANLTKAVEAAKAYAEENGCTLITTEDEEGNEKVESSLSVQSNSFGELAYCWVFYLKKPVSKPAETEPSDPQEVIDYQAGKGEVEYLKLFINTNTFEVHAIINVAGISFDGEGDPAENEKYFDVETEMMEFTDYFGEKEGKKNTVTLPVAKNDEGYYFVDPERKIICVDTDRTYNEYGTQMIGIVPYTFKSPDEVSSIFVTVFDNMRKVYDTYKAEGIESIDGYGIPLAVGLGFPGPGEDPANAAYMANINGFGCFLFSDTPTSVSMDTMGHEFTHGVRNSHNCASAYLNNTGAMEEGYADILGNLIQMMTEPDRADMETWMLGETSGAPIRSAADPHMFCQPEYIGDMFYVMNSRFSFSDADDNGGVHTNSSVISHACYEMTHTAGISIEDNFDIWKYTLFTLTPVCEFKQASEMVYFSMKRQGMDDKLDAVKQIFADGRLSNDTTSWDGYEKPEGAIELDVIINDVPEDYEWAVIYTYFDQDDDGNPIGKTATITSDANGVAKAYVPPKDNAIIMIAVPDDAGLMAIIAYHGNVPEEKDKEIIKVEYNFDELDTLQSIPLAG